VHVVLTWPAWVVELHLARAAQLAGADDGDAVADAMDEAKGD